MKKEQKTEKFDKKLVLNKKIIANLEIEAMEKIYGGWRVTDRTHCTCDLPCPTAPFSFNDC